MILSILEGSDKEAGMLFTNIKKRQEVNSLCSLENRPITKRVRLHFHENKKDFNKWRDR
jgi:hypothetical protein